MREYDDDNIRLYTPVLQRIIILVAVIIAVPVVMWTITAFVRTYVAPPKVPTFQPLSLTPSPPPDNASAGQQTASAPADAQSPATQTASNPPQASDANAPGAAPQVAATPGQPDNAQPDNAQPMPAAVAAAPATPDSANQVAAAPAASHDFAWPSPTTSPPTIPPGTMASTATPSGQDQAASTSSDGASADLPAVAPLTGHIPLPRHRPNVIAMAEPASPAAVSPPVALPTSAVPLPRARPATAPEATPSPATDATAPGGGMDTGHY